jgi:hypothetical protein
LIDEELACDTALHSLSASHLGSVVLTRHINCFSATSAALSTLQLQLFAGA